MAATISIERPEDVASKVMRRVQVSKMTRALQDRLALANIKIQNGWQNLSLDAIEPQVEERLKRRKRPASSNDTISDSASTTSSRLHSSPLTEPLFSDDYPRSGGSFRSKRIRTAMNPPAVSAHPSMPVTTSHTGRRTRTAASRQPTWKKASGLAESSPIKHTKHARLPSHNNSHLSFAGEDDDPPSPEFSEDDDADLPLTSFSVNNPANNSKSTRMPTTASPPHTPPPDRHLRRINQVSWSRTPRTSHNPDDGPDLLMYLATSPSPALGSHRIPTTTSHMPKASTPVVAPPSTPPCKSTPLPSSHMTPGFLGGFGGPNTPGNTSFNFADFVTLTPSPAQVHWTRTPVAGAGGRTPGQGTSARRRLNFEGGLMPTVGGLSPVLTRGRRDGGDGLGMELGGELISGR